MRRKGGLGRGLDALIPSTTDTPPPAPTLPSGAGDDATPTGETQPDPMGAAVTVAGPPQDGWPPFIDVPVDLLESNPRQPRDAFDPELMAELAASIKAVGVLQPIVVRPYEDRFQIVMGERRVRAAKAAELVSIPAIIRETDDDDLLRDALLENIHREDLNPLEEAAAYNQLLEDFGVTHEELAARLGRSRAVVSNAVRLLRLPASVQRRIAAGTLSAGHGRAVVALSDPEQQERLADRIVAEGMTVRMAEELVQRLLRGEGLLGPTAAPKKRTRPGFQAPGVAELAERLGDRFDTRVKVQFGKRKGKVLIEFATLDDLQRICDVIGIGADLESSIGSDPPPADQDARPGARLGLVADTAG